MGSTPRPTALIAAGGHGKDTGKLDDKERACWRQHALDWLRAELAAVEKHLKGAKPKERAMVRERLQHWQRDRELAGSRDDEALNRMTADERPACRRLWMDARRY